MDYPSCAVSVGIDQGKVTFRVIGANPVVVGMSPGEARDIASNLVRMANTLEPAHQPMSPKEGE